MYWGMNRNELHGLTAVVVLAALGVAAQAYLRQSERGDVWVEHSATETRQLALDGGKTLPAPNAMPPRPGAIRSDGRIDLNLAAIADLETLNGIGPSKAGAIVSFRERNGGRFSSVKELLKVPGIGEKTLESLEPLVYVEPALPGGATEMEAKTSGQTSASSPSPGFDGVVDLNSATSEELQTLYNIGEKKAAAIIEWRRVHGGFSRPEDFQRIPGIGPETYKQNRSRIRVGPRSHSGAK